MANHGRSSISVHIKAGGALQEERAPANRAVEQLRGPLDAPGGVQRCRETASVESPVARIHLQHAAGDVAAAFLGRD